MSLLFFSMSRPLSLWEGNDGLAHSFGNCCHCLGRFAGLHFFNREFTLEHIETRFWMLNHIPYNVQTLISCPW